MKNFILCLVMSVCLHTMLLAQNQYQIEQVNVVNIGDGRLLFRSLSKNEPLQGEQRIIDGYHSAYTQANFKNGFFDGKYQEFKYNKISVEGNYKEGRKDGIFKEYYADGITLKKETPMTDGKTNGVVKSYYANGKIDKEKGFKDGQEHGVEKHYDWQTGECIREHFYEKGLQQGAQKSRISGSADYWRVENYKNGGLHGAYTEHYMNKKPRVLGNYENGAKTGKWMYFHENGDTIKIETYNNNMLNGLKVVFSGGKRERAYSYKNDRKNGLCVDFDTYTGKPKWETNYKDGEKEGKEKCWITSSRNSYIETITYKNGVKSGPYIAVYQEDKKLSIKEGTLKEKGQYENNIRVGHWILYNPDGTIKEERDE